MSLPAGYTQVLYIESSGTQYIDTGFTANQDTRVVLDFAMSDESAQGIFGSRVSQDASIFVVFWLKSALCFRSDYGSVKTNVTSSGIGRHIADKNKNASATAR